MSERYLFRGKRTDNGEWVQGYYMPNGSLATILAQANRAPLDNEGWANAWIVTPATVGQCTGLRDKNGALIFEGDVLDTVALSNDHHQRGARYRGTVRYFAGSWCICERQYEAGVAIFPFNVDHSIVVIGNVHDNSELLEAQP